MSWIVEAGMSDVVADSTTTLQPQTTEITAASFKFRGRRHDVRFLNTPSEGGSPPGGRLSGRGCISDKISLFSESLQRAAEQAQMMGAGPSDGAEGPALQRKDECFCCDVRQQVGAERSLND